MEKFIGMLNIYVRYEWIYSFQTKINYSYNGGANVWKFGEGMWWQKYPVLSERVAVSGDPVGYNVWKYIKYTTTTCLMYSSCFQRNQRCWSLKYGILTGTGTTRIPDITQQKNSSSTPLLFSIIVKNNIFFKRFYFETSTVFKGRRGDSISGPDLE